MKKLLLLIGAVFILTTSLIAQYSITSNPVTCSGMCNGYGEVLPYHSNYQYLWDNGSPYSADSSLCAGQHYCIVRDSVGNYLDSVTCIITQPSPISLSFTTINVSCFGIQNGSITVTVTGGVFPYSYQWSNGGTVTNLGGLTTGTY